jgi:hypothetical protein
MMHGQGAGGFAREKSGTEVGVPRHGKVAGVSTSSPMQK